MEIEFHERELEEVRDFLQEQKSNGNVLVAFIDDDVPLHVYDLNCYSDPYDAQEFCYENSTDVDHFKIETAENLLVIVEAQIQDLNQFNNLKTDVMNQENYDYLKNQVKFTGFGDGLENELKNKMEGNTPTFQLNHEQSFGKEKTDTTLHFRRDDNGLYHFNKYDLQLKGANADKDMKQTFFIGNSGKVNIDGEGKAMPEKTINNNYTLKEAFNMMEGRAVNKDFIKLEKVGEGESARYEPTNQTYNSWVQLDFKNADDSGNYKVKHFHQNYGYDLQEALGKHPIKELSNESDKTKLMESLQKGNRQSATFIIDGAEQKRFVEANPQYKSVTVYDGSMKRIRMDQKEGETSSQSNKQENKNTQKQMSEDEPKASKKRSNKQHM